MLISVIVFLALVRLTQGSFIRWETHDHSLMIVISIVLFWMCVVYPRNGLEVRWSEESVVVPMILVVVGETLSLFSLSMDDLIWFFSLYGAGIILMYLLNLWFLHEEDRTGMVRMP